MLIVVWHPQIVSLPELKHLMEDTLPVTETASMLNGVFPLFLIQ
jgi:hypothetical protein